ncbi:exported hypothetical protein [Mesorhizobium sp. ORS 3324]|nr:exported hypothetical protein [Mesorhizobium sp. ORS 3324]
MLLLAAQRFLLGLACATMGLSTALAGDLTVEVFSRNQVAATASVKSDEPALTKNPSNGSWTFDLKAASIISVPIEVDVEQPPAGYQSVPMHFALPYFADRGRPYPLATAVVNDKTNDQEGVGPFLKEMGQSGSSFRNSYLLFQRAQRLWNARYDQLQTRGANSDDVGVAYWLLYAAGDLAKKYFYQPDDKVWQAADWMTGLENTPSLYSRVSRETVDALLEQLRGIDTAFYQFVINRLEQDRQTKRDLTCSRFDRLDADLSELTPAEQERIDGDGKLALKVKENVTWCAAQLVIGTPNSLNDDQKLQLRETAGAARKVLDSVPATSLSGRNAKLVQQNVQIIESAIGVSQ